MLLVRQFGGFFALYAVMHPLKPKHRHAFLAPSQEKHEVPYTLIISLVLLLISSVLSSSHDVLVTDQAPKTHTQCNGTHPESSESQVVVTT